MNEIKKYSPFINLANTPHIVEKKSEIAETIVDAAERLLNSYGYQKMTMTDLAAEAGIGVGTTYLHFASKADVAVAVVERIHSRMLAKLKSKAQSSEASGQLLSDLLWIRILEPFEFVRQKLTSMSWQQLSRHGTEFMDDVRSSDPHRLEEWKNREVEIIADVVAAGCKSKTFIPVDAVQTAKTLLAATCAFLPKNLEQPDFNNAEAFEKRVKSVIRLLVNGILYERMTDGT